MPPPTTTTSCDDSDSRELLMFLRCFGVDTRLGMLCCTPTVICGKQCVLVSLYLTAIFAKILFQNHDVLKAIGRLRRNHQLRKLWITCFPLDPQDEICRIAERQLPLSSEMNRDDLHPIDLKYMMMSLDSEPRSELLPDPKVIVSRLMALKRRHEQALRSPLALHRTVGVVIGRSVPLEAWNVDVAIVLNEIWGLSYARGYHVAFGWRSCPCRMRSEVEIEHDEVWLKLSVSEAEFHATKVSIPLPGISLARGSPFEHLDEFPSEASDPLISLDERVSVVSRWLESDPKAARLFEACAGRAFAEDSPGIEALGRLRAIASSKSAVPS